MIKVQKNDNFPEWVTIFAFGMFVDEYKSQRKALKEARKLAKRWDVPFFVYMDTFVEA